MSFLLETTYLGGEVVDQQALDCPARLDFDRVDDVVKAVTPALPLTDTGFLERQLKPKRIQWRPWVRRNYGRARLVARLGACHGSLGCCDYNKRASLPLTNNKSIKKGIHDLSDVNFNACVFSI